MTPADLPFLAVPSEPVRKALRAYSVARLSGCTQEQHKAQERLKEARHNELAAELGLSTHGQSNAQSRSGGSASLTSY